MNIGTAKPSASELAAVKHYFINNLSIHDIYTAGIYEREALELLDQLFKEKETVILAGGSTLYIRALLNGIDEMPAVSQQAKEAVKEIYRGEGLKGLTTKLKEIDPQYHLEADLSNHRRIMRALEVCISSNSPYSEFLKKTGKPRNFNISKIGLDVPRAQLYERINLRCDEMLKSGLLDEVKSLLPYRGLNALHTVGYSEFFNYLDGKTTYDEAVTLFKQHTRNYAKRQMTWFRREEEVKWMPK
jgi:tRNA dimethylallyltransferase